VSNKIELFSKKLPPLYICGFLGIAIPSICTLIPAIFYESILGDKYSIMRFFISELGDVGISQLAAVFNWGMIIGGIPMTIFIFRLGLRFKTKLGYISGGVGIFASLNFLLVGVFPVDLYLEAHLITAMFNFYGGMLMIILFSITIFLDKKGTLPKYVGWLGIGVAVIFTVFLFLPLNNIPDGEFSLEPLLVPRPNIWWLPFFEWLVFFATFLWIGVISTVFIVKDRPANQKI